MDFTPESFSHPINDRIVDPINNKVELIALMVTNVDRTCWDLKLSTVGVPSLGSMRSISCVPIANNTSSLSELLGSDNQSP